MLAFTVSAIILSLTSVTATPAPFFNSAATYNTIRNLACIRANNQGPACHDGSPDGKPDPGAVHVNGKPLTACGTDALELGIVGIDYNRFGKQTGYPDPQNLCNHKVKLTNKENGKVAWGVIKDRISQSNG